MHRKNLVSRHAFLCVLAIGPATGAAEPAREEARRILAATGIQGGLVVHLGCGEGALTAALGSDDRHLVHGLDPLPSNVERARRHIRSLGLYGKVSVELLRGGRLPYADDLVNLLVAEDARLATTAEILRVLCPEGVAYVRSGETWTKTAKPPAAGADEWTHCLHGPDGNAVGDDDRVGPPRRLRWVGEPQRSRQHERFASISAVVSSGGRVFSIQDEGPAASVLLPATWRLAARDAYNGVILWKRPVSPWEPHLRAFRSGPPEIGRRLVALEDRVYVTLGYGEPVSALDAATGATVKTYEETAQAREVLLSGGVLYVVAGDEEAASEGGRRGETPSPDRVLAVDARTGALLWRKEDADTSPLMPATLAVAEGRVFLQNDREIVALAASSGAVSWRSSRPVARARPPWSAPTLVVHDGVVLSADRAAPPEVEKEPDRIHPTKWVDAPLGELIAFSAESGERLWSCPARECFNAPVDVLVAGGLVWTGELAVAGDPGITAGRDPKTGRIERRRPRDQTFFEVGMPHHRCFRNRATNRFLVLGRAGVEFVDIASGRAVPHHWIRGTCQFGTLPCNGLLYVPPHSCACYSEAKLNGFLALAPEEPETEDPRRDRFERGPAYGDLPEAAAADPWPTYRHDAARSGCTAEQVPVPSRVGWLTRIGGRLSPLTIAGNKVFVAAVDEHTLYALDAEKGEVEWSYTAGGRIDSPPAVAGGLAVFGSADGRVRCLRASDGALVWSFRAAPRDRRIVALGRLESAWPVHGSVLIEDGVVYFAAGRSSYLDGGIHLFALELGTGAVRARGRLDSRDPETGFQRKGTVSAFDLPGALPDVLSSDGTRLYMRHVALDRELTRRDDPEPHLYCPTGFLDDTLWHRSYWIVGTRFYTGYRDWFRAGREVPAGRLLAVCGDHVQGFGRTARYYDWATPQEYHLFSTARRPSTIPSAEPNPRLPAWGQREIRYEWSQTIPVHVRALIRAGDTLFAAGPPAVVNEREAAPRTDDPGVAAALAAQRDALEGRAGALLWAAAAADGTKRGELRLPSPPVWDGMAAGHGKLYLATMEGTVLSLAR